VASLGAADRIVGIDGQTSYPHDLMSRPRVGSRVGFSADIIARLGADLVILTPARQAPNQLIRPLTSAGIPVLVINHRTLSEILDNIALLGRALGALSEAARLIEGITADIEAVGSLVASAPRLRVYMETAGSARGLYTSVKPGTYTNDILHKGGGENVFSSLKDVTQVSGEAVYRADPDVILVCGTPAQAQAIARRPGWGGMRAVRLGRVHAIERSLTLIPGPRIGAGVRRMANLLHPGRVPAFELPL